MHTLEPLTDDINDIVFCDTETRALPDLEDPRWGDVTLSGAARYGKSCKVVIFRYAIGDGPVRRWDLEDFSSTLSWRDAPEDLEEMRQRALRGEAWFAFFNSFFDRHVCNGGMIRPTSAPALPIRTVIDVMAQAADANLPTKLDDASRAVTGKGKMNEGKQLIKLFAPADGGTPQSHPAEWARYQTYADIDVTEMREVYKATRPLWRTEWEEFWTSEAINDAGLPIDKHFVERAEVLADVYATRVDELVKQHTRGACRTVNQHVALAKWVADELAHLPEAQEILVKKYAEDEDGGLVVDGLSLARDRIEKLIPYLERLDDEQGLTDEEFDVLQLLDVKLYGGGATFKKFGKMLPVLDDRSRVCGQYTLNGAQQTGRFSSRGIQLHNLTRSYIAEEAAAIEFISDMELGA